MNQITDQLFTLLNGNVTGIKAYYDGEVTLVPKSYQPALMIIPLASNLVAKSTAKDQMEYEVMIRIEVDVKTFFDEAGTGSQIKHTVALANYMEKIDSNGQFEAGTVMGILRANVRTSKWLYNNNETITYGIMPKGEFWVAKAEMTLSAITNLIERPPQV